MLIGNLSGEAWTCEKLDAVLFGPLLLLLGFAVYYRGIKVLFMPINVGGIHLAKLRQITRMGKSVAVRCWFEYLSYLFIHIGHNFFFAFLYAIRNNLFLKWGWSRCLWKTSVQRVLRDKHISGLEVTSVIWMGCQIPVYILMHFLHFILITYSEYSPLWVIYFFIFFFSKYLFTLKKTRDV